jgi:hypothetical protein
MLIETSRFPSTEGEGVIVHRRSLLMAAVTETEARMWMGSQNRIGGVFASAPWRRPSSNSPMSWSEIIIDGNYTQAIPIYKSALSHLAATPEKTRPSMFQTFDNVGPQRLFKCHRNLALCFEAVDREDDKKTELEAAIECYQEIALKIDEKKDRETVFRHEARALFEVALVVEKLGRNSKLKLCCHELSSSSKKQLSIQMTRCRNLKLRKQLRHLLESLRRRRKMGRFRI